MTPFASMPQREHMAMIAIGGDHLIARLDRHLHADHDGFLADVEVAEAADEAHAVELAGLLLEAADGQHLAIGVQFLILGKGRNGELAIAVGQDKVSTGGRRKLTAWRRHAADVAPQHKSAASRVPAHTKDAAGYKQTVCPRGRTAQSDLARFIEFSVGSYRRFSAPSPGRPARRNRAARRQVPG